MHTIFKKVGCWWFHRGMFISKERKLEEKTYTKKGFEHERRYENKMSCLCS